MKISTNSKKYLFYSWLYSLAVSLSTGAVVQAFMKYLGMEDKISLYTSIITAVQAVSIWGCSFVSDKVKKVTKTYGVVIASMTIMCITLLLSKYLQTDTIDKKYLLLLTGSCLFNISYGIGNVLAYKLPYEVIDMSEYGKYVSFAGIVSGVLSFGATSLISALSRVIDYGIVITVTFCFAIVLYVCSGAILFSVKPTEKQQVQVEQTPQIQEEQIDARQFDGKSLITYPYFYKLILPNVFRGIGQGVISLAFVVGVLQGCVTNDNSTVFAVVTTLATLIGNAVYLFTCKHVKTKRYMVLSTMGLVLFTITICFAKSSALFYLLYLSAYVFLTIYNILSPVIVYDYVPRNIIGKYTAWRMLLFTAGTAIPGFFADKLMEVAGTWSFIAIGCLCTVLCTVGYLWAFRGETLLKKQQNRFIVICSNKTDCKGGK